MLSISREHTFETDCREHAVLWVTLRDLADDVGRRLRADGRYATVGRLKLRWSDFTTITRQRRFGTPCCDAFTLREMALELFENERVNRPVPRIGFGVSGLVTERCEQGDLFEAAAGVPSRRERQEARSATRDHLRETLGETIIRRGE